MNYGSYNEYYKLQFHRFKRNPLPPKTENGEYMIYDQYAYGRDKLQKEYYTDFLIMIKVYIKISKLLLFGKENRACYKKELKHKLKNLGKVKVQKSIRKRFDNIHKKFDAFINKIIESK
jgi:hypothetical protein